jgi:hypothetical protein
MYTTTASEEFSEPPRKLTFWGRAAHRMLGLLICPASLNAWCDINSGDARFLYESLHRGAILYNLWSGRSTQDPGAKYYSFWCQKKCYSERFTTTTHSLTTAPNRLRQFDVVLTTWGTAAACASQYRATSEKGLRTFVWMSWRAWRCGQASVTTTSLSTTVHNRGPCLTAP